MKVIMIAVWVNVLLQNDLSSPSGCWDVLGSGALLLIASVIECAVHPCCSVITSCLPFVVFKHLRLGAFYLFHVCSKPQPLQIPYIEPCTHEKSMVAPETWACALCPSLQAGISPQILRPAREGWTETLLSGSVHQGKMLIKSLLCGNAVRGSKISLCL